MRTPPKKACTDPLDGLERGKSLPIESFVTFKVNHLAMAFERQWTRYVREQAGISLAQWRVVATLSGAEHLTFTQIVQATHINKSLCSRCLASLAQQQLVASETTPGDSRSLTLTLTDAGRALVARLRPVVLKRQRMLLEALSAQERLALYSAIDKLHAAAAHWEKDKRRRPARPPAQGTD